MVKRSRKLAHSFAALAGPFYAIRCKERGRMISIAAFFGFDFLTFFAFDAVIVPLDGRTPRPGIKPTVAAKGERDQNLAHHG